MLGIQTSAVLVASLVLGVFASPSNPPKCYSDYKRCAGAAGYEYVPWAPCCSDDSRCEEAPERGWGLFCIPQGRKGAGTDVESVTYTENEAQGSFLHSHDAHDDGKCYLTAQRCQGAPGHPYHRYKPCCSRQDSCLPSTNGDWGKFCTSKEATPIPVAEVFEEVVTEDDADPASCYKDNIRCQGASGHPYWPWKRCCSHDAECVDAPELGWGKFCLNRNSPTSANTQQSPALQPDQDAPSLSSPILHTTAPSKTEPQFIVTKPIIPHPSPAATTAPTTSHAHPPQEPTSPAFFTLAPVLSNPAETQQHGLCLDAREMELSVLINSYRALNGLPKIPLSKSLSKVAKLHVEDLESHRPQATASCNLHSWSPGSAQWTGVCYTRDHKQASKMWSKPREITDGVYHDIGFEIAYYRSLGATPRGALNGWKSSSTHLDVILERGRYWTNRRWPAMGIGMHGKYAVVWFGSLSDPAGEIKRC